MRNERLGSQDDSRRLHRPKAGGPNWAHPRRPLEGDGHEGDPVWGALVISKILALVKVGETDADRTAAGRGHCRHLGASLMAQSLGACIAAGVEPRFEDFHGSDPVRCGRRRPQLNSAHAASRLRLRPRHGSVIAR